MRRKRIILIKTEVVTAAMGRAMPVAVGAM